MQRLHLSAGLALSVLVASSPVGQSYAQIAADAADEEILDTLAPEIRDARLITMENLTEQQARKVAATAAVGWRFLGDFNDDGQQDLALFGTHAPAEGAGTFVLIASRRESVWRRSGLLQFSRPFIVGQQASGSLNVLFCVGCDDGGRIVWTSSGFQYAPFPEPGIPE